MSKKPLIEGEDVEQIGAAPSEPVDELLLISTDPELQTIPAESDGTLVQRLLERIENLEMAARPASVLSEEVLDGDHAVEIGLEGLIDRIPGLTVGRSRETVLMIMRRRISSAEGKNGSPALAKAICRQINYAVSEAELRPARTGERARAELIEARGELGKGLALAVAERLERAAAICREYGEVAAAWAEEKGNTDARLALKVRPTAQEAGLLPKLRRQREDCHRRLAKELDAAWLAASGGDQ